MANAKIKNVINDFLPDKIFDAHAHLYDKASVVDKTESFTLERYRKELSKILANIFPLPLKKRSYFLIQRKPPSKEKLGGFA